MSANFAALFLIAATAADPHYASIEEKNTPLDPFAEETPLTQEALQEQRGGYVIVGDAMHVGRFALHFGETVANFSVNAALEAIDADAATSASAPFVYDPATTQLIINNTRDDVVISRSIALDITVQEFDATIAASRGMHDLSGMRIDVRSFEPLF